MMNKKASVAKWVALAIVPLSLTVVLRRKAEHRRVEAVTRQVFGQLLDSSEDQWIEVGKLVPQGVDVTARYSVSSYWKQTLLTLATNRNAPAEVVRMLLDQGADVNAQDGQGTTSLMNAITWPNINTIRLLLSRGARVDLQSQKKWLTGKNYTALSLARFGVDCGKHLTRDGMTSEGHSQEQKCELIIQLLKAAGARE